MKFLYSWLENSEDEESQQKVEAKISKVVSRAKQSLNNKEFTFFQIQKSIEEFKTGFLEKASTNFEKLISKSPKRTDIWFVYLDMMVKYNEDLAKVREVFDRAVGMNFKAKSMKTLFVKYLNFEKKKGEAKRVELVKKAASRFIEEQIMKKQREEQGDEFYGEEEITI